MIAPDVSCALSRRVRMSRSAPANAATNGSSAAQLQCAAEGSSVTTTPPKPANTATHTGHATRSPSSGIASTVVKIGATNETVVTSGSGTRLRLVTKNTPHLTTKVP